LANPAETPPESTAPIPTVRTLGLRVRELRLDRRLTLEELASRAQVSAGLLSQLERGQGNPSFNTLVQIAHALAIPVTDLFPPQTPGSPLVRAADRQLLSIHGLAEGGGTTYLLSPGNGSPLEAVLVEAPPGHSTEETPFVHEGDEFGFILEGAQEVHLEGVTYTLEAGDAITYSSRSAHWYRNPGPGSSRAIWVITPPTW
jgi:transcriptional regulator with XRE-family HTH domain